MCSKRINETYVAYKEQYSPREWRYNLYDTIRPPPKFYEEMWDEILNKIDHNIKREMFSDILNSTDYKKCLEKFDKNRWGLYLYNLISPISSNLDEIIEVLLCMAFHLDCMHEENRTFSFVKMVQNEKLFEKILNSKLEKIYLSNKTSAH